MYFIDHTKKLLVGQITGVKRFYLGEVRIDFDDNYFVPTETVLVWEFRVGLTNKPLYALSEDIELVSIENIVDTPIFCSNQPKWSEKWRKDLSEDSKNWPRNEKGQWVKL